MEIELKLFLPAGARGLRRHALLEDVRPVRRLLRTLYFDTPDWRLAREGVALRVRREGRGWVQTVKTEGQGGGGLSARLEESTAVAGPTPEAGRMPAPAARLWEKFAGALGVRFETRFWRDAWHIALEGSEIEVALDSGAIRAQEREAPLCELELELKSGDAAALFEAALALADGAPLWPYEASKASRGVALARGVPMAPVKAADCLLTPGLSAAQAYNAICRNAYGHLLANLPGTLEGRDDEYLHQARVALRRLRAAFRLGRELGGPPAATLQGFAHLGRLLGEARDWDVQGGLVLPQVFAAWPDEAAAARVRDGAAVLRREAHAALAEHLLAPETTRLLLTCARWLALSRAEYPDTDLVPWAHRCLDRCGREVHRRLAPALSGSDAQIHALRLAVKRLRYALEFFQGVLDKDARAYARRLGRLQDDLGHYNDLCVAGARLEQAAARAGIAGTEFAAGWFAAQKAALRGALRQSGEELGRAPLPW